MEDNIVEIVAKHHYDRTHITKWEDEKNLIRIAQYRIDARSLLSLLAEQGCVRLAEDQTIKKHDLNNATYAEGYSAALEDVIQSGLVRVEPLVEKP
jgi:hypothetical protein